MKLKQLSAEQEELMATIRDKWLDKCLRYYEIDHEKAVKHVAWLYSLAGLDAPIVVVLDSPLALQMAANMVQADSDQNGAEFIDFQYRTLMEGWQGFYDFFREIGIVENEKFDRYLEYLDTGIGWMISLEGIAFVCPPLYTIERDERNRLHSETGYAITWKDGYGQHYLHGVYFDPDLFQRGVIDRNLTGAEILSLQNTEQKASLITLYGIVSILDDVEAAEIDTYDAISSITGKPVHYRLIEFELDGQIVRSVVVECHTEHKLTALSVPIEDATNNCMGAIAWTFGMSREEYLREMVIES